MAVALVVEDDADLRDSLVEILRDVGHETEAAADGVEALEHLARRAFDIIVSDVDMPRMNGLELAAAVRAAPATATTPILFVTAYAEQVRNVAHAEVLSKPFSIAALFQLLDGLLAARASVR